MVWLQKKIRMLRTASPFLLYYFVKMILGITVGTPAITAKIMILNARTTVKLSILASKKMVKMSVKYKANLDVNMLIM